MLFVIVITPYITNAATTGKISGRVTDRETKEPLPGTNVIIVGTPYGAAADLNGDFFILNIPPGVYTVEADMIGYSKLKMEDVRVSINSTSNLTFELSQEVIAGEEVVITADAISYKKDQTSSVRNVSSDQISILPIENMQDIVEMQAGVVDGHFRGGRKNQVSYLIDGLPVDESFGNRFSNSRDRMINIESDAIEDLEIITGTFNAEYGRAMSGIVNAVTKDGGNTFHGMFIGNLGNYFTPHDDVFIGLKTSEITRNQDYKFQLEGPIFKNILTFFTNVRYQNNDNHINGIRRFNVDDYSNYQIADPAQWLDIHNGDNAYVPLAAAENKSLFAKLTFKPFLSLKTFFIYSANDDEWGTHNYLYKYNPDGKATNYKKTDMFSFQINHTVLKSMFYEFKISYMDNYFGSYVYKNPLDSRYVHDQYYRSSGPGFLTGGQDKNHTERWIKDLNVKYDITWQANKNHSFKSGFLFINHDLDNRWHEIRNKFANDQSVYDNYFDPEKNTYIYTSYSPELFGDSTVYGEVYHVKPKEFSCYLQDKMEFNEMVINLGVRYDYFDPNTVYPSNLRNPANQLFYQDKPEQMSTYPEADPKTQISPRFGLSYQLSNTALLHFSYGHFFQMPPMYAIYQNHSFLVEPTDYQTQTGNPQLKAQKTVQYEVGLWQELSPHMGVEVNLFYRDIYDLLSLQIKSTYNEIQYGLYANKDYGNVKGLEVKYDINYRNISAFLNYSIQYTRGNADDPMMTFNRAGENVDPIARLIPMSWDQRHTVNLSISYTTGNANATLTGYYNSGKPYTWAPLEETRLARINLYPNNSGMPMNYSLDFYGYHDYHLSESLKLRFSMLIENLLDRKNELVVNYQTGRANEAIIREVDLLSHRSKFNDYSDRLNNPGSFSAPRYVKFGVGLMF